MNQAQNNNLDILRLIYVQSELSNVLSIRREDSLEDHVSIRFKPNDFRLRAIEIWNHVDGDYFRIYHAPEMADDIQNELIKIEGNFRSLKYAKDYRGDFVQIGTKLGDFVQSETGVELARAHPILAKGYGYEGLVLPDVDTSDADVLGRIFNWREVIAIFQDESVENELRIVLSHCGSYLQRSVDGAARYVGSAYGEGGILARWMRHLNSNGDAKHLNFYVLEKGYEDLVFTVLEFTPPELARASESRWKKSLGTANNGPYDGIRLNSN